MLVLDGEKNLFFFEWDHNLSEFIPHECTDCMRQKVVHYRLISKVNIDSEEGEAKEVDGNKNKESSKKEEKDETSQSKADDSSKEESDEEDETEETEENIEEKESEIMQKVSEIDSDEDSDVSKIQNDKEEASCAPKSEVPITVSHPEEGISEVPSKEGSKNNNHPEVVRKFREFMEETRVEHQKRINDLENIFESK
uniref:Uncharacterized protein n=1 Tax=Caenorhabditis tropicalis TaxID=1561998 RepID=A0A1I7T2Y3_9PELO